MVEYIPLFEVNVITNPCPKQDNGLASVGK